MATSAGAPTLTPMSVMSGMETSMDPRLQRLVLQFRQGSRFAASASTSADEIAVLARVSDLGAWTERSEVRPGIAIRSADEEWIVSARIPISRIEQIRALSFVHSLKAARRVHADLRQTVENTLAAPELLPQDNLCQSGRGIVIGVVDFGCDFAHKNFRNADGSTRILSIWDQRSVAFADGAVDYGREYTRDQISNALATEDPYLTLGYAPPMDGMFEIGSHGTHVMDIAAGNGQGSGVPGVAPEADLIFVELAASDVAWTGPAVINNNFGDSVQLLEAVEYIFRKAGDRPCVVNLSLGTFGGPHDGTSLVEQGLDSLLRQAPNRAVVVAAGNSGDDRIHMSGTIGNEPGCRFDLQWEIPGSDTTPNEMEIWYSKDDRFTVELIAPNGTSLITVPPGPGPRSLVLGSRVVAIISNRLSDSNNKDNLIDIYLEPELPKGRWTVRLQATGEVVSGSFHAWIERDDQGQSRFAAPADGSCTLGSISCGQETIVVGSFDAHKTTMPISWFSSSGPTRTGDQKPDVSAPGHDVLAAWSRTGDSVTRKSGTSMAAPAVTGCVALALAQARARQMALTCEEIRQLVIDSANPDVRPQAHWDARYGFGRISAAAMVTAVMTRAVTVELMMSTADPDGRGPGPGTVSVDPATVEPRSIQA